MFYNTEKELLRKYSSILQFPNFLSNLIYLICFKSEYYGTKIFSIGILLIIVVNIRHNKKMKNPSNKFQ